jgi:hypothetical protein
VTDLGDQIPSTQDRKAQADMWQASADERERLADERDRLADERDTLGSERDRLAERHDRALDRREAAQVASAIPDRMSEDAVEDVAATEAALRRAEAGVLRAEQELARAREAAARVEARAGLRMAATERAEAAERADQAEDTQERAWLADRRDFIAADRELAADARDLLADQRDGSARLRDELADDRERASLAREQQLGRPRRTGTPSASPVGGADPVSTDLRAAAEYRRSTAAASRQTAKEDRARAAAAWGPHAYGPTLVASFAGFARDLFRSEELTDALPQVLKFTVDAVAGCDSASITLWRQGRTVDTVASDPVAGELDELQFGAGLGPAPEALHSEQPVYVSDLTRSSALPLLAASATEHGVASVLSHGLFVHQPAQWSALGTFTLYSSTADAFSDDDLEFGSVLAAYVAVAVNVAHLRTEVDRRQAALHRGLTSRDVIGQAKGILMERQRLSAGEAFDVLRRASQRLNRKLADVAQYLAETGELP